MYSFVFQPCEKEKSDLIHMRVYKGSISLKTFVMSLYDTVKNCKIEMDYWIKKDMDNYYTD